MHEVSTTTVFDNRITHTEEIRIPKGINIHKLITEIYTIRKEVTRNEKFKSKHYDFING